MKPKKMSLKQRENRVWMIMIAPTVITLVLVTIFPTVFTWYNSMFSWNLASPQYGRKFVGLGNFIKLLTDPSFYIYLGNSLKVTFFAVGTEFVLGLGIALLLLNGFKGSQVLRAVMLLPTMITPVVGSLMWLLMYNPDYGILRYICELIGISPAPLWLADKRFALMSVISVDVWQWTPFVALLLLAGMMSVPTDIIEASSVDGAGKIRQFFHIIIPNMKSVILITLLIRLMDAFKLFEPIYILTKGGPGNVTETLTYQTYRQGFAFFEIGNAATMSLLLLLVVTFISQILIRFIKSDWEV